ncbi:MAG TPA: aminotransferase class V-fold PLP-dependent enzyme [Pyrinomonadaceae bacterium]|jgi:glutamate/tyrosine decarboxylase-like PLP-dependent enzyme
MNELLKWVAERAIDYQNNLDNRGVAPLPEAINRLKELDIPLQNESLEPQTVIRQLEEIGSPATVTTRGGRYYGFVNGGSLPAAHAASWLVDTWDQNACLSVMSPISIALEEISLKWLLDVLRLPPESGAAFVTGASMANFVALAAARHQILAREDWNVELQGLFGAPEITVIVGEEAHATVLKALALLGLGRSRVVTVPADDQGRMRVDTLPPLSSRTIICIQAGNVNTGAFDYAEEICSIAHKAGAWVHVDGAFGLWAAAAPEKAYLMKGFADADSWATDAHKWLNVTYDSGIAFVRNREHLRAAMTMTAAYLPQAHKREPMDYGPEASRRARGVAIWAAMRSLGREGLADLIERTCQYATRFAEGLNAAGYEVLNDVVINQVLVAFGDDETTQKIIADIQADGTCWCGGTFWKGHTAMRISVSSWTTTAEDVERSLAAIIRIAQANSASKTLKETALGSQAN